MSIIDEVFKTILGMKHSSSHYGKNHYYDGNNDLPKLSHAKKQSKANKSKIVPS